MNLLVSDTPIYYNPGRGPMIAFTLHYSNENSNTGIFGRGWRTLYDMRVFFASSTLQVHRDSGRIETYKWNGREYTPNYTMANYGYMDTIEKDSNGVVTINLRYGGKYVFMPENSGANVEGRIHKIIDEYGNEVVCGYDNNGCLSTVTDANGRVTQIITKGTGINERVVEIILPEGDERTATFEYNNGNLEMIEDMLGDESYLEYGALVWSSSNLGKPINDSHRSYYGDKPSKRWIFTTGVCCELSFSR